jgi:tRNA threonylcarbamoyl adenosine modification protein YjeE
MRAEGSGQRAESGLPKSLGATPVVLTRDELVSWGESLGRSLSAPCLIAMEGDLGAGKTTLAQAICRGLGVRGEVTSPTFALVNQYEVRRETVYHLDLYRLSGPADLTNLGWDEIINSGAVVIVEWSDRAGERLPPNAMRISLAHIPGDHGRRRLKAG